MRQCAGSDSEYTLSTRAALFHALITHGKKMKAKVGSLIAETVDVYLEMVIRNFATLAWVNRNNVSETRVGPVYEPAPRAREKMIEVDFVTTAAAALDPAMYSNFAMYGLDWATAEANLYQFLESCMIMPAAAVGAAAAGGGGGGGGGGVVVADAAGAAVLQPWHTKRSKRLALQAIRERPSDGYDMEEFDAETALLIEGESARRAALGEDDSDGEGPVDIKAQVRRSLFEK